MRRRRVLTAGGRLVLMRASCVALVVLVVVGVLLPGSSAPAQEAEEERAPFEYLSQHYRLLLDGEQARAQAEEFGKLLDQAWPQFAAYFGTEPRLGRGERLTVYFGDTAADMHRQLRAIGARPAGGGGIYIMATKTAYTFRQPQDYDTYLILLHEAAHQFHFLARTDNQQPPALWYVEGIAELLSHHYWDGTTLKLGVRPAVCSTDRLAQALANVEAGTVTLAQLLADEAGSYADWWAFALYLRDGAERDVQRRYASLARDLDRRRVTVAEAARRLGDVDALQRHYLDWLRGAQRPLEQVWGHWRCLDAETVLATGPRVSVCLVKQPLTELAATLDPQAEETREAWRAGLILDWRDEENFVAAFLQGEHLHISRFRDGNWLPQERTHVPGLERTQPVRISAQWNDGQIAVQVAERHVTTVEPATAEDNDNADNDNADNDNEAAPAGLRMGLCTDATVIRFRDLAWSE